MIPNNNKRTPSVGRLRLAQVVVLLVFVVLAGRIYFIQFVDQGTYVQQANENRTDLISEPAPRGIIMDRNGVLLATNVPSANLTITPALLPEDDTEELAVLERVASLLGIPLSEDPEDTILVGRVFIPVGVLEAVRQGEGIAPFRPVTIRTDIDFDTARRIIAEDLPGVEIEFQSVRSYPEGPLVSHLIGYMGPIPADDDNDDSTPSLADQYEARGYVLDRDRIGYDGLEFTFEEVLAGAPRIVRVERDVAGEIIREIEEVEPLQAGANLTLTIDIDLQRKAEELMIETIEGLRAEYPDDDIGFDRGVIIATDPRSGEVLALASWPTYNNQEFARAIDYPYYLRVSQDPKQPLFNQAVGSLYPPGSIFKMITATAGLEEGIITPEDEFFDPGEIQLENRYYPNDPGQSQTFVCWLDEGHRFVNLLESLAFSCDVYYYKVGGGFPGELEDGIGIDDLSRWMQIFGLGDATGVELPGDQFVSDIATIPDPTWKRRVWGEGWSTGDTYNASFGQGYVTSTPMQMLSMLNILINDGVIVEPTLIREITDADGRVLRGFEPHIYAVNPENPGNRDPVRAQMIENGRIPASSETMALMRQGMLAAVQLDNEGIQQDGTATPAQEIIDELNAELGLNIVTAGKTGTAEYCDNIAANLERCIPGSWPAHAWYMGYAPYENPEISVIAFFYNGQEGSGWALPAATEMIAEYFRLKVQRTIEQQATTGELDTTTGSP